MTAGEEIDRLRAHLATLGDLHPEPERVGLEALADRNPKLRAKVDALRAQLPKEPPMREPEPTPEPEAATS